MKPQQRISANEINRFMYCPYQWYYKRIYGNQELTRQYKALKLSTSSHESFYTKGTKHHSHYYKKYKWRRRVQLLVCLIILLLVVKWVMG